MSAMREPANTVRSKILAAFAETPYPGDDDLVENQRGHDPEGRRIASDFQGKDWKNVSVEMLRKHKDALPLFTPAAFRYYLPAYMIGSTDFYYEVDTARDGTIFNLTPPDKRSGWRWARFRSRIQQFSDRERDAIRSFLEFMREMERADWADAGMAPPEDRMLPAIRFWEEAAAGRQP